MNNRIHDDLKDGIDLEALRRSGKIFKENAGATILDIGDRVGLVEFHTKANSINDDVCAMLLAACEEGPSVFDALVIGNRGKHFCAGANLPFILSAARAGNWVGIQNTLRSFQTVALALKYGRIPVVAAPFSSVLGGGCEVCLHSTRVVASGITHLGLVETSVGLIPAGGGTKELSLRSHGRAAGGDPLPFLQKAFEMIAWAKVSRTGTEARDLYLAKDDTVVLSQGGAIEMAKEVALELAHSGYTKGSPRTDLPVLGRPGIEVFQHRIDQMLAATTISGHDALIAKHVATVLCGGDRIPGAASEQDFLDLEREAFLSLLGTTKTQERIEFLLLNNRPLRN
ncbi:MAG: 3-hydroxyacyl-CoA dehydrogenase [Akkermansiaceae bacterium]|nr:3-hydroxyacyl-CoA dehydrogenase [Akkermansiaceae bacterium]